MWQAREKSGIIMRNDSWRLLVRKRNCTNRMNVHWAMIMAKQTASQYNGKFEDELGTKWPPDFLAIFLMKRVQRTAKYGEILNLFLA